MWVPKVLSIAESQSSLEDSLTFLQIAHVPASRSRTQRGPELETKHTFPRVPILPKAPSQTQSASQGSRCSQASAPGVAPAPVYRRYLRGRCGELPLHPYRPSQIALPPPLRARLSALGALYAPHSPPTLSPSHLSTPRGSTPTAYREFSLPAPPHLPRTELSSHNLVPGISSEGAGLLSNLSGPTHSDHMRAVIGGSRRPQPSGGGAAAGSWPEVCKGGRAGERFQERLHPGVCGGGRRERARVRRRSLARRRV